MIPSKWHLCTPHDDRIITFQSVLDFLAANFTLINCWVINSELDYLIRFTCKESNVVFLTNGSYG